MDFFLGNFFFLTCQIANEHADVEEMAFHSLFEPHLDEHFLTERCRHHAQVFNKDIIWLYSPE